MYASCIYLLVFASIFVSFCKYRVSICKYCNYLLVSMRLTILCALNTCKYWQIYLQILTPNTCKYVQIRRNRSGCIACICMYLHVFGSICMYILHQWWETFLSSVFCMYLHVYACIWIVNDKITINTTASFPKLHSSEHVINKGTQGHFVLAKNCLLFISQWASSL
jgi:hypothetical protein